MDITRFINAISNPTLNPIAALYNWLFSWFYLSDGEVQFVASRLLTIALAVRDLIGWLLVHPLYALLLLILVCRWFHINPLTILSTHSQRHNRKH